MPSPEEKFGYLLAIPVVLFSLCVHEYSHALVATAGGDDTPRLQGRLTLNPISHIDVIGTIILPVIAAVTNLPLIGWAKPVQVNPKRLKSELWFVLVAIAGPLSNVALAVVSALILRGLMASGFEGTYVKALKAVFLVFIQANVALAIFNSLPVPPLDGSRVLFHFVINGRPNLYAMWEGFARFGFFILYLIIFIPGSTRILGLAIQVPTYYLLKLAGVA
jgi:Zn-dependent protease